MSRIYISLNSFLFYFSGRDTSYNGQRERDVKPREWKLIVWLKALIRENYDN